MRKRLPLFNLPNALTLSRFFFAPAMLLLVTRLRDPALDPGAWKISLAAFILLIVTLLTDLFDGTLARARREVTNFGKIMDPVADSTFFMTLLFGLSESPRFGGAISIWLPILVLYREIAMHILRRYAALKGNAVPAKLSGKIKMFTQSLATAAFLLLVLARDWTYGMPGGAMASEGFLRGCATFAGVYTVAVNLLSLVEYSRDIPELIAEYAQTDAPDADGKA
ncbi:MAG: CDP-alcohol phosphatidyltransferase family protein [Planctomycetota bacterium]|jgi:CDP-diacylglycerol--glycerol-3-phosphate 3-phosphatidyltransferase|nr:CDP-alcohol phosphatidyltransferase family protein [Planctomycetota bacterium]